jgi:hypothetical protein
VRYSNAINYVLYQAGWFACVLGAAAHHPWIGCAIAGVLIAVHLSLARDVGTELRLIALATTVGLILGTIEIATATYRVTSGSLVAALSPPWLLMMWAQFATTFRWSLRRVIERPLLATLFGAAGGPLAFLAGERLGAVAILPPLSASLVRLAVGWAIAMAILSTTATGRGHPPR